MSLNKIVTSAEKKEYNDSERSVICYASTEDVDRHNEMILKTAWTERGLKNYRKNPIICLNHEYSRTLPIGKSLWQKVDENGLKFKIQFANTPLGDEVYELVSSDIMNSFSVGFSPIKVHDNKDRKYIGKNGEIPDTVYEEVELLELSLVSIPANPSATVIKTMENFISKSENGELKSKELCDLADSLKKHLSGLDNVLTEQKDINITVTVNNTESETNSEPSQDTEDIEAEGCGGNKPKPDEDEIDQKIEVTEEFIHVPVRNANLFLENSFRTIDISVEKGIKAVVGRLKSDPGGGMTVQKYLFDKGMWTEGEAVAWTDNHSKSIEDIRVISKRKYLVGFSLSGNDHKKEMGNFEKTEIELPKEDFDKLKEELLKTYEGRPIGSSPLLNMGYEKYFELDESQKDFDDDLIVEVKDNKDLIVKFTDIENKTSDIVSANLKIKNVEKSKPNDFMKSICKEFHKNSLKEDKVDKTINKALDITEIPSIPANFNYDVYSKYLSVDVKDIFENGHTIPNVMLGSQLSGFKEVFADFELKDERNFNHNGTESPINYKTIQLTSEKSEEFLIEGTRFYETKDGEGIIACFYPTWSGMAVSLYTSKENSWLSKKIIDDVDIWVEKNNYLKGQKFSVSGEFLSKSKVGWDDIILTQKNKDIVQRNISKLTKDSNSRGLMLIGPGGCLDKDTKVFCRRGKRNSGRWYSLEELYKKFKGIKTNTKNWDNSIDTYLQSYDGNGRVIWNKLVDVFDSGYKECVELITTDGERIVGTPDHPIMDENGNFKHLIDFKSGDKVLQRGDMRPTFKGGKEIKNRPKREIFWTSKYHPTLRLHRQFENGIEYFYNRVSMARCVVEADMNNISVDEYKRILKEDEIIAKKLKTIQDGYDVHHLDMNPSNDSLDNLIIISHEEHAKLHSGRLIEDRNYVKVGEVESVEFYDECHTYDIQMKDPYNNFVTDGLFFVHNTGKTLTGKAIIKETDNTFIWASSDDFKHTGAVSGLSLAFKMARKLAPTVLFIEDIDTWMYGTTIDLLKTEMDGLKSNQGTVTILTSNNPENFPDTLIDRPGRFHHILSFANPDETQRKEMLNRWAKGADEDKIEDFVKMTEGYSGAHIKELIDYAKMLMEDEEIAFGKALILSFENMNEQKQLIEDIKEGKVTKSFNKDEIIDIDGIDIACNDSDIIDLDSIEVESKNNDNDIIDIENINIETKSKEDIDINIEDIKEIVKSLMQKDKDKEKVEKKQEKSNNIDIAKEISLGLARLKGQIILEDE